MKLTLPSISAVGAMVVLSGCSLFEYHPYETNVDDHNLNEKAIREIVAHPSADDTIRIIAMGDSQRFYDEVDDFVRSANKQNVDFVFLNGDISDFGLKDEFEWVHDLMSRLDVPYVAIVGNHDLSGNGEKVFKKMYGPLNNSFIVKRHKFVLLNTNSREYNFNGKIPDIALLKDELQDDPSYDYATVVSHISPLDLDFDPDLSEAYIDALRASGKVNLSLHAHRHVFLDTIPYEDGIRYLFSTSMDERMYLLLKIYNGQHSYQKMYY